MQIIYSQFEKYFFNIIFIKVFNKVIKITKNSYLNIDYMNKCLNMDKFNEVPYTLKKELLGYILTTGYAVPVQDSVTKFRSTMNALTGTNYYKALATQAIIWEIMSGERKNFNSIKPDNAYGNGFYNVINKNKSVSAVNSLSTT